VSLSEPNDAAAETPVAAPVPRAPRLAHPLADLVARIASRRRRYYEGRDAEGGRRGRQRLARPVISVGNLAAGGSGKTPLVATLAAMLAAEGERPAILTRGYGRTDAAPGVVVVSDGHRLLADLARAGDEPLMLARALRGVGVFVAAERALAGALAERRFGATVHLLDDGFQHLQLARDVDLVVMGVEDAVDRVMPAGRLREPLTALARADALLVTGATLADARALAAQWGVAKAFSVVRTPAVPRLVEPWGGAPRLPRSARVLALAGIARPARFFDDVERAGWTVVDRVRFADHHPFSARDVATIAARARAVGAELVLTTEKDVMRLLPWRPLPMAVAWAPLSVTVEPADDFALWLRWRLEECRRAGPAALLPS
jgi:tetraacyldisaccharide 4'-kinase